MVGGDLHGNCRPAQDACKELATGKGGHSGLDCWVLPWPSYCLSGGLETNHMAHTASVFG